MSWPNDWLTGLCLFLFAFGLIFSVVSLVFNVGDELPGVDLDGDPSNNHHAGGPSPLSLSTIMIFLTWFGAAGYIARVWGALAIPVVLAIAAVAGLVSGTLVWLFLAKFLWRGERVMDPRRLRCPRHPGARHRPDPPGWHRRDRLHHRRQTPGGRRARGGGDRDPARRGCRHRPLRGGPSPTSPPLDWAADEGGFLGAPTVGYAKPPPER